MLNGRPYAGMKWYDAEVGVMSQRVERNPLMPKGPLAYTPPKGPVEQLYHRLGLFGTITEYIVRNLVKKANELREAGSEPKDEDWPDEKDRPDDEEISVFLNKPWGKKYFEFAEKARKHRDLNQWSNLLWQLVRIYRVWCQLGKELPELVKAVAPVMDSSTVPLVERWSVRVNAEIQWIIAVLNPSTMGPDGEMLAFAPPPPDEFEKRMRRLGDRSLEMASVLELGGAQAAARSPVDLRRPIQVVDAAVLIGIRSDLVLRRLRTTKSRLDESITPIQVEFEDLVRAFPQFKRPLTDWAEKAFPA